MDLKTEEKQATLVALCSEKRIAYCFTKIGFFLSHPLSIRPFSKPVKITRIKSGIK